MLTLLICSCIFVSGQNSTLTDQKVKVSQSVVIMNDTTINIIPERNYQIKVPGNPTEYSILSFKNVDLLKTNPKQLEATGLYPEIYISNINHGVVIISTAETNNALRDFSRNLEFNPTFYETLTRQDTTIFSAGSNTNSTFDFAKASSINHEYKNAFNNTVDPRTGVSWSKGTYNDILSGNGNGRLLYDIIIWLPKK